MDGAGQAVPLISQRRLNFDDLVGVDRQQRHAVVGQHPHGSDTAVKMLSVAVKVERTTDLAIIRNRLGLVDLGKKPLRIKAEAYLVGRVQCRALGGAFSEEFN